MSLRHALLGVLTARPMNGYSLARFFAGSQNWVWSAPQSQIYGALKTLETTGLINASREEGQNGLETKVYSLTDEGVAELARWVSTSHPPAPTRDAFALQALYFDSIPAGAARAVLEEYIKSQTQQLEEWERHRDALAHMDTPLLQERLKSRPKSEHRRIARLKAHVFEGQILQARARIDWAEQGLALLGGAEDENDEG